MPLEKIDDTMVTALMHSLPASLGALCDVLGVPQDKAKDKDAEAARKLRRKQRADALAASAAYRRRAARSSPRREA